MRLTPSQAEIIHRAAIETFGDQAKVWLFGSRVDDRKRGGDIDLLICPGNVSTEEMLTGKIRFLVQLEHALGERKIDVVIEREDDLRPIVQIAHKTGIEL